MTKKQFIQELRNLETTAIEILEEDDDNSEIHFYDSHLLIKELKKLIIDLEPYMLA